VIGSSVPENIVDQIDALLPQTQCGQCSFNGCRPYAEAIASGEADINQCPPGGDDGVTALANLLGMASKPLNTQFGQHKPKSVAFIIEADCIGCVKCIAACPVDAILGAAKFMHTVIADECTGCELCIAPCPMDCIIMQPVESLPDKKFEQAMWAKQRYQARNLRKENEALEKAERLRKKKEALLKLKPLAQ
jgi:electron transport complex protein RnfB